MISLRKHYEADMRVGDLKMNDEGGWNEDFVKMMELETTYKLLMADREDTSGQSNVARKKWLWNTIRNVSAMPLIKGSGVAQSSPSLLSETPNLRNWFSSYTYQSPVLDSNEDFCISPIGVDEEVYAKKGFYVEDSEDEELESCVKLTRNRKTYQPGGISGMKDGCLPNPYKSTVEARKLELVPNAEIPVYSDSLSLQSEPPDVADWFSSYAYESPELDSADFDVLLKPTHSLNYSERVNKENYQKLKEFTTNVKVELLSSRELISEPSEMKARSSGTKNSKLYSTAQKYISEETDFSSENNLCPKITSGQSTPVSALGDYCIISDESVLHQRTNVENSTLTMHEGLQTSVSKVFDDDSGWIKLNHKSQESCRRKSKQDENQYISTENKFTSFVKNTGPRFHDEKSPQKFGPGKRKTDMKMTSVSSSMEKRPGEVRREVFKETTNTRYSCGLESAGKWRCPQKNKPNAGPPLKQLRLEKWVHREEKKKTRPVKMLLNDFGDVLWGIVPLGGRWGARIVVEKKQVWLGTYLEEKEAARNFDIVCLKLGRLGSLNFTPKVKEMQFQLGYSLEKVISMVKEGRYEKNYETFMRGERLTETSGGRRKPVKLFGVRIGTGSAKRASKPVMLFGVQIG
ncbi:hypothetical protein KSS87_009577 [Heliosperma pusillum]|nr:hypothetical protein KSS87_009577 [Heliosperma pusillum]